MANEFADWLEKADEGQDVIKNFEINGVVLYSVAPPEKGRRRTKLICSWL